MTYYSLRLGNKQGVSQSFSPEIQYKLGGNITDGQTQLHPVEACVNQTPIDWQQKGEPNEQFVEQRESAKEKENAENQNMLKLILEDGADKIQINVPKYQTFAFFKLRVGSILNCDEACFDLLIEQSVPHDQTQKLQHFLNNYSVVSVKRKMPHTSFLSNLVTQFRDVESIASDSDHVDPKQSIFGLLRKKNGLNIKKKSSCSSSLTNIKEYEPMGRQKLKQSSIEPYTMHKNEIKEVEEKQNKLLKILDAKQAMSFGSLQESKATQTQADVYNEEGTMYWRFCCPFGCRVADVKSKIAKIARLDSDKVEFVGVDEDTMVEDIANFENRASLTLRITS